MLAPPAPAAPPSPVAAAPALPELLVTFRRSLQDKLQDLTAALSSGNHTRVAALSHKLKGSAGMYGLPEISETAGLLEAACQEGQSRALLSELLEELGDLVAKATGGERPS
jgi:HPt (histidine-containing phosphotransfer) domain-containing protein